MLGKVVSLLRWLTGSFVLSALIGFVIPIVGSVISGLFLGAMSCMRTPPSLGVAFMAFIGCFAGSILPGWMWQAWTLLILCAAGSFFSFLGMYRYVLKLPARVLYRF